MVGWPYTELMKALKYADGDAGWGERFYDRQENNAIARVRSQLALERTYQAMVALPADVAAPQVGVALQDKP
jgi:hypothetical protein